ncbi:MAG: PKD domain-containing protein, partial [Sediminibacterium sp.]|nr:PKD domain-containing protein [Sediminibacterium sp.]
DLNPPLTIQNEFSASNVSYSATCSNTPFKINLSLTYQPTKIVVDFYSAANLIGTSLYSYDPTGPDSTYTSNGKIYYLYRVPQTYKFLSNGNYPVKITTTSAVAQSDGCSNNDQQEITDNVIVNAPPTADFKIESNGCINNAIALTDLSDGTGRPIVRWLWEFSDGTTSAVQNPVKTFTTANNYTAKLTSITDFGCIAQVPKLINVSAKPIAGFAVPATRCLNSNIIFTDASSVAPGTASNTIAHWRWDLDNGAGVVATTNNAAQNFTYTSWGNKNVYLVTESNTGCISDTFRIAGFKINPLPEVGFILPEVCLSDAFAPFTDTSKIADGSKAGFIYSWIFDDGISSVSSVKRPVPLTETIANPNPSYKDFGNYIVSLKITSNAGCIDSIAKPFKVNGSTPIPKFEVQNIVNATPLCSNDSIRIINQSKVNFGEVTRLDIYWDTVNYSTVRVRDESPAENKVYSYRYPLFASAASPAFNPMKISIVAYSGQSPTCIRSVNTIINLSNSPKATFSDIRDICNDAAPRQINQGSFVSAMAATQTYSGKGIDATGLFNPATMGVGTDQLKYLVQNANGCKDSAIQPITVWPSPVANWNVQATVCEKNDLTFTDLSVPNFSNIVSRNWIFGDGTTQTNTTANSFTKKYASAQNYTASLQVITDSGCKSTINQQVIKVNPLPIVNFSLPSICLPDGRGKFNNQSSIADGSEALFSYQWNFNDPNDPSGSTLKEPTHKYIALGPYTTQLKITSKEGCVDSLSRRVTTIYPWPKAAFSSTPNEICLGDNIQFNDLGNGISSNPVIWNWDLANGNSSNLQNPNKRFTDSGTFTIQYYFLNAQGCVSDTVSKQIVVHPYPKLTLGPKINVLEGGNSPIKPQYKYGTNLSYLWTPSTYLNNDTDSIPITSPLADITYELRLTGIGGCSVTDQILIKVLLSPVVPNAFSPNGDGINDRWSILYLESYPGATVDVYDRYGQVVFSSVGYSVDWDGTIKGKNLPIGTYYYIINPKNGRKIVNGSVTIIR